MDKTLGEHLVISNDPESLITLQAWVNNLSIRAAFSEKLAFHLDLVLSEAVTNIINYSYDDQYEHFIQIHLVEEISEICVDLIDDGNPFNPLTFESPDDDHDLLTASIGGRGIKLIRSHTTNQQHIYTMGKNVLKLVFSKDTPPVDANI